MEIRPEEPRDESLLKKPTAEPPAAEVHTRGLWRCCAKGLLNLGLDVCMTLGNFIPMGILVNTLIVNSDTNENCGLSDYASYLLEPYSNFEYPVPCPL